MFPDSRSVPELKEWHSGMAWRISSYCVAATATVPANVGIECGEHDEVVQPEQCFVFLGVSVLMMLLSSNSVCAQVRHPFE